MANEEEEHPCGYGAIAVTATATSLDTTLILQQNATAALLSLEGGSIRIAFSTTPTVAVGHLSDPPPASQAGPPAWRIVGQAKLLAFQAVLVSGAPILRISYFH